MSGYLSCPSSLAGPPTQCVDESINHEKVSEIQVMAKLPSTRDPNGRGPEPALATRIGSPVSKISCANSVRINTTKASMRIADPGLSADSLSIPWAVMKHNIHFRLSARNGFYNNSNIVRSGFRCIYETQVTDEFTAGLDYANTSRLSRNLRSDEHHTHHTPERCACSLCSSSKSSERWYPLKVAALPLTSSHRLVERSKNKLSILEDWTPFDLSSLHLSRRKPVSGCLRHQRASISSFGRVCGIDIPSCYSIEPT